MANYHRIYDRIWSHPSFRQWSEDARMAALYLLSCPHRNTEGLFRLPTQFAAYDLGWTAERTDDALADLEADGFIERDTTADLVWIVNALRWNEPKGPKRVQGAVNALADLPDSPLRLRFLDTALEVCPDLARALSIQLRWGIEGVSEPGPRSDGPVNPQEGGSSVDSLTQIRVSPGQGTAGYPIEGVSEGYRNPIDYSPSSSPSSSSSPTTTTSDSNSDPPQPGGGGGINPATLGDELVLRLGYVSETAGPDLIGYVERALARGWPPTDLTDLATEIAAMDPADIETTPLRVLLGGLRRRANNDPGPRPSGMPAPPPVDERRPPVPEFEPDSAEMNLEAAAPGLAAARANLGTGP